MLNYTITGGVGPLCTCQESSHCPNTTNECDITEDPPVCKCNGKEPCDPGQFCLNREGQPECSCLVNDHCTEFNADICDVTTNPPHCRCGDGPPCIGEECIDGRCGVSIKISSLGIG